jgi:hypothetical protein
MSELRMKYSKGELTTETGIVPSAVPGTDGSLLF